MSIATSSQSRPNRGCLWGCLAVLAVFLLPVLMAAGYGAWFFTQGYARDPVLRGVVELVRKDGMAETVLGQNIHITGMEGSALTYMWGGQEGSYVVLLSGSKGAGTLHVTAREQQGRLTVQSMILEGPRGERYDLLHHVVQPGDNSTTAI